MTEVITSERFFDGHTLHGPSAITVVDGVIGTVEPFSGTPDHSLVHPGLVDLQMNGFDDVDCSDADPGKLIELDSRLASLGTTSYLATLITAELDVMSERINRLAHAGLDGCIGLHLEGRSEEHTSELQSH